MIHLKRAGTRRWRLWEWEWELKHSHSSQKSTMSILHLNEWEFIFWSCNTTYHSRTTPSTLIPKIPTPQSWCCHLVFSSSDEENPVISSGPCLWHSNTSDSSQFHRRAEPLLPVQHHINYNHMSIPSTDQFFQDATAEENFPTAPIDDDIWLEIKFQIGTYVSMSSHSEIASVPTPVYKDWTYHNPL